MEKNCPCCENHCSVEHLGCPTGKEHFGIKDAERPHPAGQPERAEDKVIVLLRKCGHFLHHNVGRDGDTASLLEGLPPQEREELARLLEKCLENWQRLCP